MKRNLLLLLLLTIAGLGYSQTTYYWVGGAGPVSFTANANWNTTLDGTGTTRTASAANDILIFDGSNIGGTSAATGTVIATATSASFGQLKLQNGANVNLGRSAAGSATLTLTGDGTAATDLVVEAGCTLTLGSAVYNYDVNMVVTANATAFVSGTVYLSPLSTSVHTRSFITAAAAGNVVFASGSACHITDSTATSGFNASVASGVLFKTGASLYYYTGRSPIGNNSTTQFTNFEPGSNLYFMQSNVSYSDGTTAYASSSWVNQKTLANVFVRNGSVVKADGSVNKIENFSIDNTSSFITHTSGNTAILGNLMVDGSLNGPTGSSNVIVIGGNTQQTIGGTGSIEIPSITIANHSDVVLMNSVSVINAANIYGKLNFGASHQIKGAGSFTSRVNASATSVTGNTVAGSYVVTGVGGTIASVVGLKIQSNGIDANTNIVGFSTGSATLNLSQPATATTTGTTFIFSSDTATLVTANPNGLDSLSGSVVVTNTKAFQSGTNYIINAATTSPFGINSGETGTFINSGFVEINAAVTVNRKLNIWNHLTINDKLTLLPLDTVHIRSGAILKGSFGTSSYIATGYNVSNGTQALLQYDAVSSNITLPIGTNNYYLPVTITPTGSTDITASVFQGITKEGTLNGTPFIGSEKLTVVNAVWQINRLNGTGNADLQLNWNSALEGATFTTLPDTDIGLITNNGSSWSLPSGTANNSTNTVTATITNFGSFSVGAVPQVDPFVFNPLPAKTYGDADFNGGATSLNTAQPIVYSSSSTAVATIVNGQIHITGAGTTNITASQASDGFYPVASVTQSLTVTKAALHIKADNKIKFEGLANPTLTETYSGFVLNETATVLLTPAVITTTAVTNSAPGTYPITVSGATSNNYTITFEAGVLTVQPKQNQTITFNAPAVKTYGNTDFNANASSTNNTIPVTFSSSNTSVATINTAGVIHITGAGTTTITASQAGSEGYFAATPVARTLTVNKVNLTIRVLDTSKVGGTANPTFTITYTGFVLGETVANLTTAAEAVTTAGNSSIPGYYTITLQGATSQNYNLNYVAGRLTILPIQGTGQQYLNAYVNSNGNLYVRVYSPEPRLGDVIVYDMNGRPLVQRNIFMPVGFIQVEVFIPTLTTGMHVVTVKGDAVDLKRMIYVLKQ
jgi:hypothetical protein